MSNFFNEDSTWLTEKIIENLPSRHKRNGNSINCRCFICGDGKTKTKMRFHYYPSTNSYYCFNCCASGTGLHLLELLTGDDYHELKRQYIKETMKTGGHSQGTMTATTSADQIVNEYKALESIIPDTWKNPLSDIAKGYLQKRKIFEAPFIDDLTLYSTYDKEDREFILIPWQLNGVDAYYQINDFLKHSDRKYIFPYKHQKRIFGLDNVDRSWQYIICFEGVYDSLFVKNGVAIGGKSLTANQRIVLQSMFPYHKIVFALDNDDAGRSGALKEIEKDTSVMFFNWMKKYPHEKDINDLVINTNRTDLFTDEAFIESMICGSLQTKLFLTGFKL